MTSILTCPDETELLALAMGEPATAEVVAHVDECPSCQASLERLRSEIGLVRANAPKGPLWPFAIGPTIRAVAACAAGLALLGGAASAFVPGLVDFKSGTGWHWFESDPTRVLVHAEAAFKSGRFVEAGTALERLARLRPPTPVDRYLRAQVDMARGRDEEALAELAAIPAAQPVAPLGRLRAGQIEIRRGRARPAEAAFLAALELLPRAVQPRKELVYIYNLQHRQAELDQIMVALIDLNVLDFQYVLHWTKTRNTSWNPTPDLSALQKFVAADPLDRWSRLALVKAYRRLNRLDLAERELAALSPSDPDAITQRVLVAMDRQDLAMADSLLALGSPDDPELARLRGQLMLSRGDTAAAIAQFRLALRLDPVDRVVLSGLGTALRAAGRPEEARPYLEAAKRHDALWRLVAKASTIEGERDPGLPHELGMACAAAGRFQEARAWLKLAIERDPLDSESQRTLFDLEHGAAPPSAATKRSK